jgi:hypothetical protein
MTLKDVDDLEKQIKINKEQMRAQEEQIGSKN